MRSMLRVLFVTWLGVAAIGAVGGEAVTAFQPGKLPPEVLNQVKVKATIAEFLDPDETRIGKELGYLLWKEILFAISDQSNAGVIIAHAPGNMRLVDLLQQDYHEAALRIAQGQRSRMAMWGAVGEDDGRVVIDTYLTLVGDLTHEELALRLFWGMPGGRQADSGLAARLSRTRFNFPRITTTRAMLFERPLTAQAGAAIRAEPNAGATLRKAADGELLVAVDMRGDWFMVKLGNGGFGWVDCRRVQVPPRVVELQNPASLRSVPSAKGAVVGSAAAGRWPVLHSRYVGGQGLWYRVSANGAEGWIPATLAKMKFTLPIVHFVAGLYRYQLGRYDDAAREFDQYARSDGASDDPPSLSSAYQLLASSHLMARGAAQAASPVWMKALDSAAATTPFDPGVFRFRALSIVATQQSFVKALPDLRRALDLNPGDAGTQQILTRLKNMIGTHDDSRPMPIQRELSSSVEIRKGVDDLVRQYPVR